VLFALAREGGGGGVLAVAAVGGARWLAGVAVLLGKFTAQGRIFWVFPKRICGGCVRAVVNRNQYAAWVGIGAAVGVVSGGAAAELIRGGGGGFVCFGDREWVSGGAALVCLEALAFVAISGRKAVAIRGAGGGRGGDRGMAGAGARLAVGDRGTVAGGRGAGECADGAGIDR